MHKFILIIDYAIQQSSQWFVLIFGKYLPHSNISISDLIPSELTDEGVNKPNQSGELNFEQRKINHYTKCIAVADLVFNPFAFVR